MPLFHCGVATILRRASRSQAGAARNVESSCATQEHAGLEPAGLAPAVRVVIDYARHSGRRAGELGYKRAINHLHRSSRFNLQEAFRMAHKFSMRLKRIKIARYKPGITI